MTAARAFVATCLPILALAASGCFSLGGDAPPERSYEVVPPLEVTARPAGRAGRALQVELFSADEALVDTEIVWRRGLESGAYANHRWTRPPAASAREMIARALTGAGVCEVVASEPPLAQRPDYRLDGHLSRFGEQDREDGWFGVVELTAVLRDGEGRELWRRTYASVIQAEMRNPLGVAAAVAKALLEVSEAVASDVDQAVAEGGGA